MVDVQKWAVPEPMGSVGPTEVEKKFVSLAVNQFQPADENSAHTMASEPVAPLTRELGVPRGVHSGSGPSSAPEAPTVVTATANDSDGLGASMPTDSAPQQSAADPSSVPVVPAATFLLTHTDAAEQTTRTHRTRVEIDGRQR